MAGHNANAIDRLIGEIFRLHGAITAAGDSVTKSMGLSSARWQVMGAIEATGGGTASDLARQIGVARQSVQRIVTELVAGGYCELLDNPRHRRARTVAMTDKGWTAYRAVTAAWKPTAERMDRDFGPENLAMVTKRLASLRDDFHGYAVSRKRPAPERKTDDEPRTA